MEVFIVIRVASDEAQPVLRVLGVFSDAEQAKEKAEKERAYIGIPSASYVIVLRGFYHG